MMYPASEIPKLSPPVVKKYLQLSIPVVSHYLLGMSLDVVQAFRKSDKGPPTLGAVVELFVNVPFYVFIQLCLVMKPGITKDRCKLFHHISQMLS